MIKPKVGDTVRVTKSYFGSDVYFEHFKLEEYNYCLGFYGEGGPRTPCNFTPLSDLFDKSPDSTSEYYSNYGQYWSDYIQTFEIIKS